MADFDFVVFIRELPLQSLTLPTLLVAGHLKRFMRGIIEMMEVMKSGPPTPSTISLQSSVSAKLNGVVPPLSVPPPRPEPQYAAHGSEEASKADIIAAPPSFDEVVTPTEKRLSHGVEDQAFQAPAGKPQGMGKGTFTRMRSLVAIQLAGGSIDEPDGDTDNTPNGEQIQAPLLPKRRSIYFLKGHDCILSRKIYTLT